MDTKTAQQARFKDKVVLITGAGHGIGRTGALMFAREGALVVVNDIHADRALSTAQQIVDEAGTALPVVADVTQEAEVRRLVQTSLGHFGRLDVLYNNAGVFLEGEGALPDLAIWEATLRTNLTGTYLCCKAAIPEMVERGGGVILLTSSFVGLRGVTLPQDAYAVSKGGLFTLTRALAVRYGRHGIRVNCMAPGPIQTAMFEQTRGGELHLERIPLRRLGRPEEVAQLAAFLASDEASLITGAIIPVDGGLSAISIHHSSGQEY